MPGTPSGLRATIALAVVLVAGAALRFHRLDRESLWNDEVYSIELARRPIAGVIAGSREDGHPPLYHIALHYWMRAFGEHAAAVRALSAALGVLTLPVFHLLTRRLFGWRAALLATALLACSPYHVYYSQEARNYALLVLLTVASFAALAWWIDERRAAAVIVYGVATVGMFHAHAVAWLSWAAQLLWLALAAARSSGPADEGSPRWRLSVAASAPALLAGLALLPWPWAPWTEALVRQTDAQTTGLQLPRPSPVDLIMSFFQFAGSPLVAAVLLPAAALEVWRGLATRTEAGVAPRCASPRSRSLLLLAWLMLPHAVLFGMSQVAVPVYITRATIAGLPPLMMLAAGLMDRPRPLARAALAGFVLLVSAMAQIVYFRVPTKEQWNEAASFVDRWARPGDAVAFDVWYGQRGFDHYSRAAGLRKVALSEPVTAPRSVETLAREDTARLWLVRFHRRPAEDQVLEALGRDWTPTARARFVGIEVYLFRRTPGAGAPPP